MRLPQFAGIEQALEQTGVTVNLFGKPRVTGSRRMGVALATADSVGAARGLARTARDAVTVVPEDA